MTYLCSTFPLEHAHWQMPLRAEGAMIRQRERRKTGLVLVVMAIYAEVVETKIWQRSSLPLSLPEPAAFR